MNRLSISNVLGELIKDHFSSARRGERECRLLVPGLTQRIAREVHQFLREQEIDSYLVVGENEETREEERHIRAVSLTSVRIGSFVSIVSPGELAHIPDSIRGSGGTIRSLVFSEEWPWRDQGIESFRFDGKVLEKLVHPWSRDDGERKWMYSFVLEILEHTASSPEREEIFIEHILGEFNPDLYPGIDDARRKFLCHVGVPLPRGELAQVSDLAKDMRRLCKTIVKYCENGDAREQAGERITECVEETKREETRLSLDRLFDGIGRSTTLNLDMLAFYRCWGLGEEAVENWKRLDAQLLAELFDIKDRNKLKLSYSTECQRRAVSDDGKKLATFVGEQVKINVTYDIPKEQFKDSWFAQVRKRGKPLCSELLQTPKGDIQLELNTGDITGDLSKRISLSVALVFGERAEVSEQLYLHLCGENRPAFTIVKPSFEVVDASPEPDDGEASDHKFDKVDESIQLTLFSHDQSDVSLCDENEKKIELVENVTGIWEAGQRINVSAEPNGMATRICSFGDDLKAVIFLEAGDLEKGEFTIEDELRVKISSDPKGRLRDLVDLFGGTSNDPYLNLGKVDEGARHRMTLAKIVTSRTGWRPLLTNLLEITGHKSSGSVDDFINYLGVVNDKEIFKALTFPSDAQSLLENYSDLRNEVRQVLEENYRVGPIGIEHPTYASCPIFVDNNSEQIEEALKRYLDSYKYILDYLHTEQENLRWREKFILAHLDCVVHWEKGDLKNALFLLGPWHPLVLARRFMLQAALFSRAKRLLEEREGKNFKHLTFLLAGVQGFRWVTGMAKDEKIEAAHATVTSDPGWHLALSVRFPELASREQDGFAGVMQKLRKNWGLTAMTDASVSDTLVVTCLANYLRAFPSRRSIGIRIRRGYAEDKVIEKVDGYIHDEEGATIAGKKLPGGIRLYLEEALDGSVDAQWTDPPLYVYKFKDDEECIQEGHPDVYMSPPANDFSFRNDTSHSKAVKGKSLPRGHGRGAVFSKHLCWITEGNTGVPKGITYEYDAPRENSGNSNGIGEAFTKVTGHIGAMLGDPFTTVFNPGLPFKLDTPWVVIPGHSIDPAVLVKYVQDDVELKDRERALWDYRVDVTGQGGSYFVLSTIPAGFKFSVNGFFGRDDIAEKFITDLGKIGIAIGGEALKSGRHALGIIGLVGAARLLTGEANDESASPADSSNTTEFLVPVDSFSSFFGKTGSGDDGKRADLLAVRLISPGPKGEPLRISARGVESKFVSGTFTERLARNALKQAKATSDEFEKLVSYSLCQGAMPERLALLEILAFGLRITSPGEPGEIESWVAKERAIYEEILSGNYEYSKTRHAGLLVSTEGEGPTVSKPIEMGNGLWVRLTKEHWPGVSETPRLKGIRRELREKLGASRNSRITVVLPVDSGSSSRVDQKIKEPINEPVLVLDTAGASRSLSRLDKILIGFDDVRRPVYFDPQSPAEPLDNMNVMITGSSGTGKTQLLKYLIYQLRKQGKNVLILDMKNDFVSDHLFCEEAGIERIFVSHDGLPFNPLIPYPVPHPGTGELVGQFVQHIEGISSVLKNTCGLGAQQQAAVRESITEKFEDFGIPTTRSIPYSDDFNFPDFPSIGEALRQRNVAAHNRLASLLHLFHPESRDKSFHSLVDRSTVLDLSQISSKEIQNSIAQLVVMSSHGYYNSQPQSGNIRQFLIFDEGHRVLDSSYMLRLARECRAYGVGIILSSQYPTDFPEDVSASIATKIIHGNGRNVDRVRDIVRLLGREEQREDAASLDRFQAFVDNRHYPHTIMRTMHYPLYLVWSKLKELGGVATRDELSDAKGLDTSRLPMENLIIQLERLGLAEERDGQVYLLEER